MTLFKHEQRKDEGEYPSSVWERKPKATLDEVLESVAEQSYSLDEISQMAVHFGITTHDVIGYIKACNAIGEVNFKMAQLPTGQWTNNT